MKLKNIILASAVALFAFSGCSDNDNITYTKPPVYDMSGFAKGADIGWLTEMEHSGRKFYNSAGGVTECMSLLRELGMNSVRLRVWVNPQGGWCGKEDVLIKAYRAHNLGMRIMINFHYSDSWADPSQQTIPAAWEDYDIDEMKQAVADHTTEVLTILKDNGITPEWVQVGNETNDGMLWPMGNATLSMANYAALTTAGYDAAKSVFPDIKVIVHISNGFDKGRFQWIFDGLKANGGKWDMIGMSVYPSYAIEYDGYTKWQDVNDDCFDNITALIARYDTDVMIVETGMKWDEPETSEAFLTDLITRAKAVPADMCKGVMYWEPQCYEWEYQLGAFDDSGRPTAAMNAFGK